MNTATTTCVYHNAVEVGSGNRASTQFSQKTCVTEYPTASTTQASTTPQSLTEGDILISFFLFYIALFLMVYGIIKVVLSSARMYKEYTGNNSVDGKEHDIF